MVPGASLFDADVSLIVVVFRMTLASKGALFVVASRDSGVRAALDMLIGCMKQAVGQNGMVVNFVSRSMRLE